MNASSNSLPALVENAGVLTVVAFAVRPRDDVASITRVDVPAVCAVKLRPLTAAPLTVVDCDAGLKV